MKLITFDGAANMTYFKASGAYAHSFHPDVDYAMPDTQCDITVREMEKQGVKVSRVSRLNPRLKPFHIMAPGPIPNPTVLLYNGSGGYGDQIVTIPVAKILQEHGYQVHILTDPGNHLCWYNIPFIKGMTTPPVPLDVFNNFNHHAMFDFVVNIDEHADQMHPTDVMLNGIGLEPGSIAPEKKVPTINLTPQEEETALKMLPNKDYAMIQMSASNTIRSQDATKVNRLICKMCAEYPNITWVVPSHPYDPPEFVRMIGQMEMATDNLIVPRSVDLRVLWAMIKHAKVVIAPDSMYVHVAGVFGTPCVGLWGVLPPESRVKYYRNHLPVENREFCSLAPCFAYFPKSPPRCPDPEKPRCGALMSISAKMVHKVVKTVLG